jgi:hypothetical protein
MLDSHRRFGRPGGAISLRRVVNCEPKAERNENRPRKTGGSVRGSAPPALGLAAYSVSQVPQVRLLFSSSPRKRSLPQPPSARRGSFESIAANTPLPLREGVGGGSAFAGMTRRTADLVATGAVSSRQILGACRQGSAELVQYSDHGLLGHTIALHHEPNERVPQQAGQTFVIVQSNTHVALRRCVGPL